MPDAAQRVLDFWFGTEGSPDRGALRDVWFKKDAAFDAEVGSRFGPLIERGLRGELAGWSSTPQGALALIVVLDQFTRNAFRDTPRSFAGDPQALAVASATIGRGHDLELPTEQRSFVYLPFEHAEHLMQQDESVRLFTRLADADPRMARNLDYAKRHRLVIEEFGRFPHRNVILGRQSTADELAYLARPGAGF